MTLTERLTALKFHPSASHVPPDYRDGYNHAVDACIAAMGQPDLDAMVAGITPENRHAEQSPDGECVGLFSRGANGDLCFHGDCTDADTADIAATLDETVTGGPHTMLRAVAVPLAGHAMGQAGQPESSDGQ